MNLGAIGLWNFLCASVATMAEHKSFCWLVKLPCFVDAPSLRRWGSRWTSKLRNGPWRPATIGLHGEYLLGLWDPAEPVDWSKPLPLQFDLRLAPDGDLDPRPVGYEDFCKQESAFISVDDDITAETYADDELPVSHVIYSEPAIRSSARPTTSSTAM